jgi:arginyl-tRNA synthetase
MNLIIKLENIIKEVLKELDYEDEVKLNLSGRPDLGDYQYNGSFSLAKKYHKSPLVIADEIILKLQDNPNFKDVSNVNGFINLSLSDKCLIDYVNEVIMDFNINTYHEEETKTYFFDYGGANVAKALHAGHLRSPNIGEALKRLFESVGYKTISDVHFGDWGRPMGLIICEIKRRYPDLPYFNPDFKGTYPDTCPVSLDDLYEIYPYASQKAKEDPAYLEEARDLTVRLQNKEKGIYDLYQSFTLLSINDILDIYQLLNTTFDLFEGEKDADEYIKPMLDYLKENNLTEISEGATIIDVKEDSDKKEIPPVILIKSNGGLLYDTTELATLYSRCKRFKCDGYLYLTDIRQELHFVQAFRAGYKTKIVAPDVKLEWYGFGTMNGPDGKPFKTRDGAVMPLRELINIVKEETKKVIKDNIKEEDKDNLALTLAIAAIKYADLLPNRASDYIFDPVKFSDINGKTGPYILYGTVRMSSLLKKANLDFNEYHTISTNEERDIILNLINLREVLEKSFKTRTLNEICEYLYKLTSSFNAFYSNHEVLSEDNKVIKESYLSLIKLVLDTNKYLLNILAIDVPDQI